MTFARKLWVVGSAFALWISSAGHGAPLAGRPPAGKGIEAKTLLIYADTRTPYSLADSLAALQMQLQRVATTLETAPLSQFAGRNFASADYVVVFCPQPFPVLATNFLQTIAGARQPVLWIGYGADQLEKLPPFKEQFDVSAFAEAPPSTQVTYRGRSWNAAVDPWIPVNLTNRAGSEIVLSLQAPAEIQSVERPICWKTAHVTFFASVPAAGTMNFLFSDLLLDFFGVRDPAPAQLFLRLDGYHCRQNHRDLRRLIDYLHTSSQPFLLAVIPVFHDAATDEVEELDAQPDFIDTLRYAQERGGRLILQGYTHAAKGGTGEEPEFWDAELDQPLAGLRPEEIRGKLERAIRRMFRLGLFPLAWQTPHYAASRAAYGEVARHFSTAVERVQLSDATARENFVSSSFTLDGFRRFIVPENLGSVGESGTQSLENIRAIGQSLGQLRGTVAGCAFSAYLPLQRLVELTGVLGTLKLPFLDLAEADHWVQLPDAVLLTGNAQRTVTLREAVVRWKAFSRGGKLLAEEQAPAAESGERIFKRRGVGDYELFEWGKPN